MNTHTINVDRPAKRKEGNSSVKAQHCQNSSKGQVTRERQIMDSAGSAQLSPARLLLSAAKRGNKKKSKSKTQTHPD
jgi:hypothetical protein